MIEGGRVVVHAPRRFQCLYDTLQREDRLIGETPEKEAERKAKAAKAAQAKLDKLEATAAARETYGATAELKKED